MPADGVVQVPVTPPRQRLASFVRRQFEQNVQERAASGIDQKLMRAMQMACSEYSPEEIASFESQGVPREIYMPVTDTKIRAALAQMKDIFSAPGDKPWTLRRTPVPEVPPEVAAQSYLRILSEFVAVCMATDGIPSPEATQAFAHRRMDEILNLNAAWADRRIERMEKKVHDQMVEGGFIEAFSDYANNVCRYGTALIIGPVPSIRQTVTHVRTRLGTPTYEMRPKRILTFDAVNPWDCYPQKGAKTICDGNLCLRVRFTPQELHACTESGVSRDSVPEDGAWYADAIDAILGQFPEGGATHEETSFESTRRLLQNESPGADGESHIEGVRMFGAVRGSILRAFGMFKTAQGKTIDPVSYYEIDVITVLDHVVYCKITDPRFGRPVVKGVFYENPGSWWGDAIADKLVATQKMVNMQLRNLATNSAMCSGSMMWVNDAQRLINKTPDALVLEPWKVFAWERGVYGQSGAPMGLMSAESRISEILDVIKWEKNQADEDTGIPAYTYGMNATGGAGRTASGLAMLTEAASRGMKMVIGGTDRDVIRRLVKLCVMFNMLYDPDVSIKGDCEVNPSGIMGMILREQETQRRRGFISLAVSNPLIAQCLSSRGIGTLLREEAKDLGVNPDDVVKSNEALEDADKLRQIQQLLAIKRGEAEPTAEPAAGGQAPQSPAYAIAEGIKQDPVQSGLNRGAVRERMGAA